jgi:hypothetical protein
MAKDDKSIAVCSHFKPHQYQALDAWRRAQDKIPSASESVAYLTGIGIEADRRRKQYEPETTTTV